MKNHKNILITGASGFTGKYFIHVAKAAGYRCIALLKNQNESATEAEQQIYGDICDKSSLIEALQISQPDYIIHLAAVSFAAHDDISSIYQTNLLGTLNLLEAVTQTNLDINKIILASSANIYGNATKLPITEECVPMPINHYGVSKYALEMAGSFFKNLPIIIARPFNYTGLGQSTQFVIPKLVKAFKMRTEKLELGNIDVSRDFSDIRDVANTYVALIEKGIPGTTYNICSGKATSLRTIIDILKNLAEHDIKITVSPEFMRPNEIQVLYGSADRIQTIIGDDKKYNLIDTLKWMLEN